MDRFVNPPSISCRVIPPDERPVHADDPDDGKTPESYFPIENVLDNVQRSLSSG